MASEWRVWLVSLALGMLLLAGCGTEPQSPELSDEERVAERAELRWAALVDGALEEAYDFEAPGYREVYTLRAYRGRLGQQVRWTAAEVLDTAVDEDRATVRVLVSYVAIGAGGQPVDGQRPLEETWLREDGEWWHLGK